MFGKDTEVKESNKTDIDTDATFPGREQAEYYDFYSEQVGIDPSYEIRLYRIPPKESRQGLTLLEVYSRPPHENDIGLKYGGGDYLANGRKQGQRDPDKRIIKLDKEIWDRRKEEHDRKSMGATNGGELETSLNLLDRLVSIMGKMNGGNGNGNGNKFTPDKSLSTAFKEVQELQVNVFKEGMKDRSALYKELKQLQLTGPEKEKLPDSSQDEDSLWNHPLVTEAFETMMDHGLSWLKSDGVKKEAGRTLIQGDPNFQELVKNEKLMIALYNRCKADDKIGKDTIDKIYNELGMQVQDVPDESPETKEEKK